jgi:hypothetical protein
MMIAAPAWGNSLTGGTRIAKLERVGRDGKAVREVWKLKDVFRAILLSRS